ncbi:ribonuclease HI family protein [Patescibacteria group bacterium]|nr:ribonuclease HI family protein [Patescibacteria group bacterium]MBU4512155.1 ribonuclease HI family protein [Patescibacteria group bacterium]MCG2693041.1 ribonuclease HI family protein [Candidatus Parcubacteria bacterium]
MPKKLKIYTDGGARGNPGPAAYGVVIYDEGGKKIGEYSKYIGETTNNQAEYQAVDFAMQKAKELKDSAIQHNSSRSDSRSATGPSEIEIYSDSELIVNQLNQKYKVKNQELGKWFLKIWNLRQGIGRVSFIHVPRSKNKEADRLVNEELDRKAG